MAPPKRILLFTRYPEPGKTKTRLIPVLGVVGAARLQASMTLEILQTIKRFSQKQGTGYEICLDGGSPEKASRWLGKAPIQIQGPGHLGEKMARAFQSAFHRGAKQVVLVGSDIPGLNEACFEEAFSALATHDVVLGPSLDGGYWLVGLNGMRELFHVIPWSTPEVLARTRKRCEDLGLSLHFLSPLQDVDTPEDLRKVLPRETTPGPYLSVIIPTLNEAPGIQKCLESARSQDTEPLVVDGGSRDDTVDQAKEFGARVIKAQSGRAAQQNAGARAAKGEVLLFLHADTCLPPGYVEQVFDALLDPKVSLGAFRFKTDLYHPGMRLMEMGTHLRSTLLRLPYGDQGLFMPRKTFFNLGGFPVTPIAEDLLLVRKAGKKGRVEIVDAAAVTSARRWKKNGILKTFLINQFVVLGLVLGVSTEKLARLYTRGEGAHLLCHGRGD